MRAFTTLILAATASLVSSALVVVNPTSATECSATLPCTLSWKDDGAQPPLSSIGPAKIAICSGSPSNQTCLQTIATSLDVSKNSSVVFHTTPNIGPTGRVYFVKITSLALKEGAQAYSAYSAYFSLVGMTGAWDPNVEGLAQSAAGDATTSGAALPTTQAGATTAHTTASLTAVNPAGSSSTSSEASLSTNTPSAAMPMVQHGVLLSAGIVAVLVTLGGVGLGALALGL